MNCKKLGCKKSAIASNYITTIDGEQELFTKKDQLCLDHCRKEAVKRSNKRKKR